MGLCSSCADEVFQEGDVDALGQPISDDLVVKVNQMILSSCFFQGRVEKL